MFTGIIEEVGTITDIQRHGASCTLCVHANTILQDLNIGDSIAVNGICLTATSYNATHFYADVMHESIARTSLANITINSKVNLERAMQVNGRFGGHIVSGHIDGTGVIENIQKDSNAIWYTIQTSPSILKYIVEKGSITIDGISLTIASVSSHNFRVSIIPHTLKNTTLLSKSSQDVVNLENDCVGKYIEKLLFSTNERSSTITKELLQKYGF